MKEKITTRAEAEAETYGHGCEKIKYRPTQCVATVAHGGRVTEFLQCKRKPGYGPDGLYCKAHAEKNGFLNVETVKRYTFSITHYSVVFFELEGVQKPASFKVTSKKKLNEGYAYISESVTHVYETLTEAAEVAKQCAIRQVEAAEKSLDSAKKLQSFIEKIIEPG